MGVTLEMLIFNQAAPSSKICPFLQLCDCMCRLGQLHVTQTVQAIKDGRMEKWGNSNNSNGLFLGFNS